MGFEKRSLDIELEFCKSHLSKKILLSHGIMVARSGKDGIADLAIDLFIIWHYQ